MGHDTPQSGSMKKFPLWLCCLAWITVVCAATYSDADWNAVTEVMNKHIAGKFYPGATAVVGNVKGEILYSQAVGHFTYGAVPPHNSNNPAMDVDVRSGSCHRIMVPKN